MMEVDLPQMESLSPGPPSPRQFEKSAMMSHNTNEVSPRISWTLFSFAERRFLTSIPIRISYKTRFFHI